jgi:hypothetical protein
VAPTSGQTLSAWARGAPTSSKEQEKGPKRDTQRAPQPSSATPSASFSAPKAEKKRKETPKGVAGPVAPAEIRKAAGSKEAPSVEPDSAFPSLQATVKKQPERTDKRVRLQPQSAAAVSTSAAAVSTGVAAARLGGKKKARARAVPLVFFGSGPRLPPPGLNAPKMRGRTGPRVTANPLDSTAPVRRRGKVGTAGRR